MTTPCDSVRTLRPWAPLSPASRVRTVGLLTEPSLGSRHERARTLQHGGAGRPVGRPAPLSSRSDLDSYAVTLGAVAVLAVLVLRKGELDPHAVGLRVPVLGRRAIGADAVALG